MLQVPELQEPIEGSKKESVVREEQTGGDSITATHHRLLLLPGSQVQQVHRPTGSAHSCSLPAGGDGHSSRGGGNCQRQAEALLLTHGLGFIKPPQRVPEVPSLGQQRGLVAKG